MSVTTEDSWNAVLEDSGEQYDGCDRYVLTEKQFMLVKKVAEMVYYEKNITSGPYFFVPRNEEGKANVEPYLYVRRDEEEIKIEKDSKMSTLIRFPVGDWSGDGHDKCDYFQAKSNKSVQEVREIHFSAKEKLGFDIGDICHEYEESEVREDILEALVEAGFDIQWAGGSETARYFEEADGRFMTADGVFNLWIDILMFLDPELKLEPVADNFEDITFYGFDEKKRHLQGPGYGCFWI